MKPLNEAEKRELVRLIEAGEAIPEFWRGRLFPANWPGTGPGSGRAAEIGKEYRLVYDGKMSFTPPVAGRREL